MIVSPPTAIGEAVSRAHSWKQNCPWPHPLEVGSELQPGSGFLELFTLL